MNLIVAIDRRGAIGRGGNLLYNISADLRRFKALTTGGTVIMGRKTFESLPKGALPNRRNMVITTQADYAAPGIETFRSLEAALAAAEGENVFVIGGAQVYRDALPLADTLLLTVIDAETDGADTFFPTIPLDDFAISEMELCDSTPPCRFVTLVRKK